MNRSMRKINQLKPLQKKGFTLVEVLLTTLIFPVILFSVYSLLNLSNMLSNTNEVYAQLNQNAMQILHYIGREIGQTSPNAAPSHITITQDGNNNSVVTFQIPVDWDNDGDVTVTGTSNATEWGAYDRIGQTANGHLNYWIRYSISGTQLIREVLNAGQAATGTSVVVANNIKSAAGFTVTRFGINNNTIRTALALTGTDAIGQFGKPRTFQATFSNDAILRNAVN